MRVRVIGSGIAGLTCALAFARRGVTVEIHERAAAIGRGCSHYAGGMLAPFCEVESADPLVARLGEEALSYWSEHFPETQRAGTLVVSQPRDLPDLRRFSRRTSRHEWIEQGRIAALAPDLAERFSQALYFPEEAHLDPRRALAALARELTEIHHCPIHLGVEADLSARDVELIVDCRGLAARPSLPLLRGVKGEMLLLRTTELSLPMPVRMLHPRTPVYIVPRADHVFMVGATMIENDERGRVTGRSMVELLSAAYALHPALGEAEILEIGCDIRPAFPNNLPRIVRSGHVLRVNGFYRHGYLLAPSIARMAASVVLDGAHFPEVMD